MASLQELTHAQSDYQRQKLHSKELTTEGRSTLEGDGEVPSLQRSHSEGLGAGTKAQGPVQCRYKYRRMSRLMEETKCVVGLKGEDGSGVVITRRW
jgi:hypothetical protein